MPWGKNGANRAPFYAPLCPLGARRADTKKRPSPLCMGLGRFFWLIPQHNWCVYRCRTIKLAICRHGQAKCRVHVMGFDEFSLGAEEFATYFDALQERCNAAKIGLKQVEYSGHVGIVLSLRCGRDTRDVEIIDQNELPRLLALPFDEFSYLSGLEAIWSSQGDYVELLLHPAAGSSPAEMFNKLFGMTWRDALELEPIKINSGGSVHVEIGLASDVFRVISEIVSPRSVTLKVSGVPVKGHDLVLDYLKKLGGALLFQVELVTGVALLMRRHRVRRRRKYDDKVQLPLDLKFPDREFDDAPLSLYWYARSAAGMPLLQYLAYYQVIEFYFPLYSQYEAHKRLKQILKHPAFRTDRDADISKLLSAIQVSRSGSFGDERAQLKAAIEQCVDEKDLRDFLSADDERKEFFSEKTKLVSGKLSIDRAGSELRNEVALRVYEIRCKIVHTKSDSRDGDFELLLPFSKEADLMHYDIELAQFLAQQVLVAGSRSL